MNAFLHPLITRALLAAGPCAVLTGALFAAAPALAQTSPAAARVLAAMNRDGAAFEPDALLLQFRAEVSLSNRTALINALGAVSNADVATALDRQGQRPDLRLVKLPAGTDVKATVRRLLADDRVAFAEPNWRAQLQAPTADPLYVDGTLWNMQGDASRKFQNPYGSHAAEAWANGNRCNRDLVVGIIDTGVLDTHEDLVDNMWTNPFDPVNGIDDDGNGHIDDVHGWDFGHDDATLFDGRSEDYHGTHVAGTIAATGGNGIGVVGVCPQAQIISSKAFKPFAGIARIVKAIDYLTDLRQRLGVPIVVTNHSYAAFYSESLFEAIQRHVDAGILVVAAAGNSSWDNDNPLYAEFPASFDLDAVISVAAIDAVGELASFSNYGAVTVDIAAPGVGIPSTVGGPKVDGVFTSEYRSTEGTSMAAPHVTGAALLYKARHPEATALQIKAAILDSAVPTLSLQGKVLTNGRLDVSGF